MTTRSMDASPDRSRKLQLVDSNSAGEVHGLHSLYQKYRQREKPKHKFCTRKQKATPVFIQDEDGSSGTSKDKEAVERILEGAEVVVSTNIGDSEAMDKQPCQLNFGLQEYCKHKAQSRYLLNDKEIDWNEETFFEKVEESKLEDPVTSSETEELLLCLLNKVDELSSATESVTMPLTLSSELKHPTSSAVFTQELANCEKKKMSHRKNMVLPCDRNWAVGCIEDSHSCGEALSVKTCQSLNRKVFYAKDNVSDLQKSPVGIGKLNLCDIVQRSHSGTVSKVNNLNKGGKRLKMWGDEEAENSCLSPVKRICLADISGSFSTHSSLSHKMGFRCVDEQSPANSYRSALSLFSELGKLSPVFKQNVLQDIVKLFCGTSIVCSPFSLLGKPVSVTDFARDHKICIWGGNSAARVSANVAKCMLLETRQKMNAVHVTLCAYLKKCQNDLLQCTLTERKEDNNGTSSQTIANTIISVKENVTTEVQAAEKEKKLVDCSFLGSLPKWNTVSDVQSETAEDQDQIRDNGIAQRKSYNEECVTGDSPFLPSLGAAVAELQLLTDGSSLVSTEDNEEFGISTTDELWTLEDIFASGEECLPLHRPVAQKTTYRVSDKRQGSGDEHILKLNNACNSNSVLSPDYGFWEGDDTAGLLAQTTNLNDKLRNVLDEHSNTPTCTHFPKPAEGNRESYDNIFQKVAEYKEKEVVERLCELLDVHTSDSNRKYSDNCSDTKTAVVTKLPNITKSDQAVDKYVKRKNIEQKQEGKVVFQTDSQFHQISPEHALLDDTGRLRKEPQRGGEAKEKEILDCPLSITDIKLSLSSEKEDEEEEEDDDDSSSESSSSVVTVVLNPSCVPQSTHRCPQGNQSQQTYRGVNGCEDGGVSQQNDHTYTLVERELPGKAISCVARTNSPVTDSERNCDNSERKEAVHHILSSGQSCSGPESDAESADGNEPPMQCFADLMSATVPSTEFGNSVSLLINSSATRSNRNRKLVKDSADGGTVLPVKESGKLSESSRAEKESPQSNPVAQKFTNIEQAEHFTSKRKRKCVSESVEVWLQNNIQSFPDMQNEQVFEEISKDVACDLPKESHNASRVSVSPIKHSSIDRRSDEKTGFDTVQTDVQSFPDSAESPASPYKRRRGGEGLVTVQTHLTGECSVRKTSKEVTRVKLSCQYCGKLFYRPSKLKDHIGTHTLPYHCSRCGRRFATESQLVTHEQLMSCSANEKCRYKCEGCDQKFLQRICLLNHVENHLKQDEAEGVEKSRCKLCGKVFSQAKLLLLHKEVHKVKRRLHTCGVCGKTFERQAALTRHRKLHLECSYCGEYFKGKELLRIHIRQHLEAEKERALKQKWKVQQEENVVRDEVIGTFPTVQRELSLLICPDCGEMFRWKTALERHSAEHRREDREKVAARVSCDNCGATFTSRVALRSHTRQHVRAKTKSLSVKVRWPRQPPERTGEEDVASLSPPIILQFSCEKCHADFPRLSELQRHSCGLGDQRQHTCYICDKAFLSPQHLSRHKRVHFPAHECRYCGRTFSRRYEWRYHEWSHENVST